MNNVQLFQRIRTMQEILSNTTNEDKIWRKMYEDELQYHLDCIAQDPIVQKEYEQWRLSIGADDHPEDVISDDIQQINRQLIDLIAQIQNAEPAPHRESVEDGYYKDRGVNGMVFRNCHMDEIHKMITLCQQAYDIQKSVCCDDLRLVPVLSVTKLKDKYKENFGWNTVLCDSIGVFVRI